MEELNAQMRAYIEAGDLSNFYETNLGFHNVFVTLSENMPLRKLLSPIKRRLYDFPRQTYLEEWEKRNCDEHEEFIRLIREGDREGAARLMRDVHWSYEVQKDYIRKFHSLMAEEIEEHRSSRHSG